MLFFIQERSSGMEVIQQFQYISCYSLSWTGSFFGFFSFVSIHLMLFFIEKEKTIAYDDSMFQYISCYSLSIIWILWVLCFLRFNTSHVILYPKKTSTTKTPEWSFNTSHVILYLIVHIQKKNCVTSFNTSHVILYRRIKESKLI